MLKDKLIAEDISIVLYYPFCVNQDTGKFIESDRINFPAGGLRLTELEMAFRDLQQHSQPQEPALEANLQ